VNQPKAKVAVFLSGGGSNLQALIDASHDGSLSADIVLVVSNRRKAFGLERARRAGIDTFVFKAKKYDSPEEADSALAAELSQREVEFIALAGFLSLIPEAVVKEYRNRIINIHPALLPKYGGKGMYGHHVHEAVLASGDTESGPTVHLVDEKYDSGAILEQIKMPIREDDTPESLAARVLEQEHKLYPKVLDKLIKGEYNLKP
jgi:phosphoribosylglycinamide formyltransferase-1